MKLWLAVGVFVGIGALLSVGLVLAAQGSPWLLLASTLGYAVAFVRLGCAAH